MSDLLTSLKKEESEANVDFSLIKIIVLGAVGAICVSVFSYYLSKLFQDVAPERVIAVSISGVFLLTALFLQSVFVKDFYRSSLILFLQTLLLFAFFYPNFSFFTVLGVILTFGVFVGAERVSKREADGSIRIKIYKISRVVIPKLVTAVSIFVAVVYTGFYNPDELMPYQAFEKIVLPADALVKYAYPVSLKDTFRDAAQRVVDEDLKKQPAFEKLSPSQKSDLSKEYFDSIKLKVRDYLRVDFNDDERIVEIFYRALTRFSAKTAESYENLFLLGVMAVIFIFARMIGALVGWVASVIGALVYEICLALGFATVLYESKSKEIVLLK